MSVVRYIAHQNRLAKLISAPGGKTMEEAIDDAETGLQGVAEACLADIDRLIGDLAKRAGQVIDNPGKTDALYVGARKIAGLAAICKRPCLGRAAHSLCVLIDNSEDSGRWHREAVMVHISTLQLLRGIPNEAESTMPDQLAGSLDDMVKRLADEDRRGPAA